MKRCFRCGVTKSLDEFYTHPRMKDGHLNKCKECTKEDVQGNRREKSAHYAAYDQERARKPARRAQKRIYEQCHNKKHPEKYRARYLVNNAIRDGKLVRQPCEVCDDPHAEAHHDDYSRPLDIHWLCFLHHRGRAHAQTVHDEQHTLVSRVAPGPYRY